MTSPFEAAGFKTAPFTITQAPQAPQTQAPQPPVTNPVNNNQPQADSFSREAIKDEVREEVLKEIESEKKKKIKKKPFSGINRMIAGFKKFGIAVQEYSKGFGKGVISGGTVGGIGFVGMKLAQRLGAFKNVGVKAIENVGEEALEQTAKAGGKIAGLVSKKAGEALRSNKMAIAIGVAGAVIGMGFQMWKAQLNVNERNAKVEHRYEDESHMDS